MKKLLLSICLLIGITAYADVTETFAGKDGWIKGKTEVKALAGYAHEATSPTTGIKYSFVAAYCDPSYTYLMLGSKECATEASMTFALPEKFEAISFTTGTNASQSAVYTVTAGETVIDAGTKWGKGATKVFNLPAECQAAGTVIKVASTHTGYNGQIAKFTLQSVAGETPEPDEPEVPTAGTGEGTAASPFDAVRAAAYATAGFTGPYYVQGKISEVAGYSTQYKSINYYISNDGTTTNQFYIYSGKSFGGADFADGDLKVGDVVVVKGSFTVYNGAPQINYNSELISLNGETGEGGETPEPEPEPDGTACADLAAVKKLADEARYQLNCSPVVVYVGKSGNSTYNYVYDGENYALIYKGLNLEVGDKIKSGSVGKVDIYNNLIELVPDAVEVESKGNAVPSPTVVPFDDLNAEITAANQDAYITIKNVVFESAGSTGVVTQDGESVNINVYKRFDSTDPVSPGTFNITGFISVYQSTVQINYTVMERVGDEPEIEIEGTGEGTLESPYDVTRALSIITNGKYTDDDVYVKGIISEVGSYNSKYGSYTYYISEDGTTTAQLEVYGGLGTNGAKLEEGELKVGDNVVIKGKLLLYGGNKPEINMNSEIVTLNGAAGVENVVVDANAPVEYFNLQGVRVAEPANGIFIRRQGNKAVKVLVK